MTKLIKLTTAHRETRGGMKWRKGQTNHVTKKGTTLCSDQVLHAYRTPELAIFFDPIHGEYTTGGKSFRMAEIDGDVVADDGTKTGSKHQTIIRWLEKSEIPVITTEQHVEIGIRATMEIYHDPAWTTWAKNWLSGKDRSARAACAVWRAACASYAAYASYASWRAANAAYAAEAVWRAACANAAYAAYAAEAACAAAEADMNIQKIIERVIT